MIYFFKVEVDFGNDGDDKKREVTKERPSWMIASTVTNSDPYGDITESEAFQKNTTNDESIDALLKETETIDTKKTNPAPQMNAQNDSSDDEFIDDDDDQGMGVYITEIIQLGI